MRTVFIAISSRHRQQPSQTDPNLLGPAQSGPRLFVTRVFKSGNFVLNEKSEYPVKILNIRIIGIIGALFLENKKKLK